ncbi:MAG: Rab family GTPase [Candidatus Hodarchaeota archaeon]
MLAMRIALLGDGAVGKTSIRKRFMGEGFSVNYQATIGADFAAKKVKLPSGEEVEFQIWDLAGQPTYESVRPIYYQGCMGALVIYDLLRESTYENINSWVDELWKNSGMGKVPIIILGNKADLMEKAPKFVPLDKGNELADHLSQKTEEIESKVIFYPTSAKTGKNVDESFKQLSEMILTYFKKKKGVK